MRCGGRRTLFAAAVPVSTLICHWLVACRGLRSPQMRALAPVGLSCHAFGCTATDPALRRAAKPVPADHSRQSVAGQAGTAESTSSRTISANC